jgi:succinoglycan biosynthesis protein ExoM
MKRVNISICTYKRPQMLEECLKSVFKTKLPENYHISISVIDNDDAQTAKPITEKLSPLSPIDVFYIHERRRGIPLARNKALKQSSASTFLIFIDDDEQVAENWLIELIAYAEKKGGNAVICGQVISKCPPDAPKTLIPFFKKKPKKTGVSLTNCATNNVLIPRSLISEHNLFFDEKYPLAGGTDTLFFSAAHRKGIQIFSCAEAIVHETVPLSRISMTWLARRKFRAGINVANYKLQNGRFPTYIFLSSTLQILLHLICSIILLLAGQKFLSTREWFKICRSAGSICGTLGFQIDSYKTIEGQ